MVERILVIDAGESATLIVVAERILGEIQIRHHVSIPIDLGPADQIVPETIAQLRIEYEPIRVILIIPQSETVSQRITLQDETIEEFVTHEANRFQEIEGNLPVVDHQALGDKQHKSYWLTYCQPDVIEQRLRTIGLQLDDIDDVTSAAQGFWGFYESVCNNDETAYVIDVGHHHTALMGIRSASPVFATSFTSSLPTRDEGSYSTELQNWYRRLELAPSSLHGIPKETLQFDSEHKIILGGDEKLLESIQSHFPQLSGVSPKFSRSHREEETTPAEFSIALGVARAALGSSRLHISLLPERNKRIRDQRLTWNRLRGWTTALALVTILLLLIGTWQQFTLNQFKRSLLDDTNQAIARMIDTENSLSEFADKYERIRPILRFQQETTELVETMAALQASGEDPTYWLVLLADNQSYASRAIPSLTTNNTENVEPPSSPSPLLDKPGFVAEFTFVDQGESMRRKLLSLVDQLNASGLYTNVDTLPDDLRRPLANTNVLANSQYVALSLELHRNYFDRQLFLRSSPDGSAPPSENSGEGPRSSFLNRREQMTPIGTP